MKVMLGIDGGGTHTRAIVVSSDGRIEGTGESGPSNYHNVGLERASASLRSAAKEAMDAAGRRAVDSAFLGCAGVKSASDIARVRAAAETAGLAPAGEIVVANDLTNALAGGLSGRPGIAVIAGTGTNCLGRGEDGRTFMCGGWGWLLDDMGGGTGLALEAMRAAARAADGRGRETKLLPALMAFLEISEPNELLERLYVPPCTAGELASFAPVVVRLADEGDRAALAVLKQGADALARLVAVTAGALEFPCGPDVVLLGGCGRSGPPYQPLVEQAIGRECPRARLLEPELSPLHGAALNALRAADISPIPKLQLT